MKFIQLANSLKEAVAPVYLIEGDEAYFRDHAVKSIREACALSNPALNDVRYEGEAVKGERLPALRDSLYSLPFFDEKRLVRLHEFYPSEREWETVLGPYVEKPCPSTVLVIVNSGKKGAYDVKKKKGVVYVDCSRESEDTLTRWLFSLMRREGLSADADAVGLMVRYCASDAARMRMEIDKLKLLLGEGGRVTRAVVEENVSKDVEYKVYELTQAASRKSFAAFSQILNDLMNKGYDETAALASLVAHYKTLSEISSMRGSDAEVAKALGVKPYAVQKNREIVARLGRGRAEELYRKLFELSCGAKSGLATKTGALSAAIAEIFFG